MNTKAPTILGSAPLEQVAVDLLKPFGDIVIAPNSNVASLRPLLQSAIALIVRNDVVLDADTIQAATDLRVIGRPGAGYDNVNVAAATARKIPVVYAPTANARAVAEAAVALLLALGKRLFFWDSQSKQGNWNSRYQFMPRDMQGATLGIIGFGSTGRSVAELIRPFQMTVLACDPYVDTDRAQSLGATLLGLDELLSRSDYVSIHASLTDETRGMINRARLERIKPGCYLVNLARGGLIESLDVLFEALQSGQLAGVGLDVFDPEPPDVSHPIFKHPNCVTSPHALAGTSGATYAVFKSMAEDIVAVLNGARPRHVVNPEALS